jgi:hypothetical protein
VQLIRHCRSRCINDSALIARTTTAHLQIVCRGRASPSCFAPGESDSCVSDVEQLVRPPDRVARSSLRSALQHHWLNFGDS